MKTKRKLYQVFKQKLCGITLVALAVAVIAIASTGTTVRETDATPIIVLLPLGVWLTFTKEKVIF